jgi:hypothetical protein
VKITTPRFVRLARAIAEAEAFREDAEIVVRPEVQPILILPDGLSDRPIPPGEIADSFSFTTEYVQAGALASQFVVAATGPSPGVWALDATIHVGFTGTAQVGSARWGLDPATGNDRTLAIITLLGGGAAFRQTFNVRIAQLTLLEHEWSSFLRSPPTVLGDVFHMFITEVWTRLL